jgi:hypothetical protein
MGLYVCVEVVSVLRIAGHGIDGKEYFDKSICQWERETGTARTTTLSSWYTTLSSWYTTMSKSQIINARAGENVSVKSDLEGIFQSHVDNGVFPRAVKGDE